MGILQEAFVAVKPDTDHFDRDLRNKLRRIDAGPAGKEVGRRFGGSVMSGMKAIIGAQVLTSAFSSGVSFLKEANAEARESVQIGKVTSAVIKATGGAAKVTASQVGDLATSISNATGKDDEAIQSGANLILTFKNVRNEAGKNNDIFDRATKAAVDLSATGFGSISGSSKTLAKALNDPIKGMGALGKAGVTFTAQQKEQITALATSGDVLGAQKLILQEVESQVGGVAAASADMGERLTVSFGNFKEQVGTALLPVTSAFAGLMVTKVFPALSRFVDETERGFHAFGAAFKQADGTVTSSGFPGFMERLANLAVRLTPVWAEVSGGFRAFGAAFKAADGDVTSSGFAGQMERLAGFLSTQVVPALNEFGGYLRAEILPQLQTLGTFIATTLLPAWANWYAFLASQMIPIIRQIGGFLVTQVIPAFMAIVKFIGAEVVPGFMAIVETVKSLLRVVVPIIMAVVGTIIGQFSEMRPQIMVIWDSVKSIITGALFIIREVIGAVTTIIRTIWDRWGDNILSIVKVVFSTVFTVVAGAIKAVAGIIKLVVALIKGDWKGAWEAIKQIFSGVWMAIRAILSAALGLVRGLFTAFGTWIKGQWSALWVSVKTTLREEWDMIRTNLSNGLGKLQGAIRSGRDTIGRIWDGLKEKMRGPVNWVITKVLQPLAGAYDKVAGIVGAPKIGNIPTLAGGGPVAPRGGRRGADLADGGAVAVRAAGGGVRPRMGGMIRGRGGPKQDNIAGIDWRTKAQSAWVSAKEFVTNARQYAKNKRAVETINSGGEWDLVPKLHGRLGPVARALGGAIPNLFLGGTTPTAIGRVSQHKTGYPWARWAGDLNGPGDDLGNPVRAWKDGVVAAVRSLTGSYGKHVRINHEKERTLYAHLSRIGVDQGQRVTAGQVIGNLGSTGNSTGPHLHFEVSGGSSPLGKVIETVRNMINPRALFDKGIGGLIKNLTGRIPGGDTPLGQMLSRMATTLVGAARNKLPAEFAQPGGAASSSPAGIGRLGPRAAAARRYVIDRWGITNIGGYANRNIAGTSTLSKHALGKAIDVMTYDKTLHSQIANEFIANSGKWGTDNVITGRRIWNQRGWHGYNGIPHDNHIHIDFFKQGGAVRKMLSDQKMLGGLGAAGLATGGIVQGGRGGLLTHIGEGRRDELVTPLPRNWRRDGATAPARQAKRPIVINVDLGAGLVERIEGVIDQDDQFHATVGRTRRG